LQHRPPTISIVGGRAARLVDFGVAIISQPSGPRQAKNSRPTSRRADATPQACHQAWPRPRAGRVVAGSRNMEVARRGSRRRAALAVAPRASPRLEPERMPCRANCIGVRQQRSSTCLAAERSSPVRSAPGGVPRFRGSRTALCPRDEAAFEAGRSRLTLVPDLFTIS